MKKQIYIALLAATMGCAASQAQLTTVSVTGADYSSSSQGGSSDSGSLSLATGISNGASSPATLVYTVSGLDINGSGGTNDTVDITMTVTALSTTTLWANAAGTIIGDTSNMQNATKRLTYDFVSMTVNLDGGTDNGPGTFDGFTGVNLSSWADQTGNDAAIVNGVTVTETAHPTGAYSFAAANSIVITGTTPGTDGFRVGAIDFQLTVGTAPVAPTTVTVTGADNGDPLDGASDSGTLSLTTRITSAGSPQDMVYTISGLDIDGVGAATDSVDITFTGTTDSGPFSAPTNGYLSTNGALMSSTGDYVQLVFSSLSVNLNGGTNNGSGSFDGFTSVKVGGWGTDDEALVNDVSTTFTAHPSTDVAVTGNTLKIENVVGTMRVANWDFQLTVGPATTLPTIQSFTATPSEIDPGDTVTLEWATTNADTLTIDQGVGDVTGLTSTQLVVNAATTYTLTAQNADGSVTSSVPVSLTLYPPSILSFTAIDLGTMIELVWETADAVTISIDQGVGDVTGSTSTQVADGAHERYTLTVTNADGTVSRKAYVHPQAATGKPNIVFVLVDDWGWTDHSSPIAAQGNESLFYQTPNFNTLADSGVTFTSAYAQPNCSPTRAALLTGQYSCRSGNGVYNVSALNRSGNNIATYTKAADQVDEHANGDADTITIGEAFINSGYVTAHIGKYHAGATEPDDPTFPLNQGFDFNYGGQNGGNPISFFALDTTPRTYSYLVGPELDAFAADYTLDYITNNLVPFANGNDPTTLVGTKKHITDAMGDAFISFMDNHKNGAMSAYPVYVQLHFYAVHSPIEGRPDLVAKHQARTNPVGSTHTKNGPHRYAALIEGMDQTVGRVMNYLDDPDGDGDNSDSIRENTLVILTSDNGGWESITENTPLRGYKSEHFEGGIRVPAVISMPGTVPANKVSDTLIHVVDYYPTMLDFADGIFPNATSHPLDGTSLYDHLLDPEGTARNREPIFYHFPGYINTEAYACSVVIKEVGGKRYKYIYAYDPYYGFSAEFDQHQLYNLTDDIGETVNLLDYIDLENASDPNDISTVEEYWNYILHKELANELSNDLRNWLIGDPADTTWNPIYVTYRDTYPGIDPALVGENVPIPEATIPDLEIPSGQVFRLLDLSPDFSTNEITLEFKSESGFNYDIKVSENLLAWDNLSSGIPGESGSTTVTISDPDLDTETKRFYRVELTD